MIPKDPIFYVLFDKIALLPTMKISLLSFAPFAGNLLWGSVRPNVSKLNCHVFYYYCIVKKSQLRHAARFKLPSGKVLASVPGDNTFETKDFIFKLYYVSPIKPEELQCNEI
jgi:hypothetical protein